MPSGRILSNRTRGCQMLAPAPPFLHQSRENKLAFASLRGGVGLIHAAPSQKINGKSPRPRKKFHSRPLSSREPRRPHAWALDPVRHRLRTEGMRIAFDLDDTLIPGGP